jgi:hypothetical protein
VNDPTAAEIRAFLRDRGQDVPERGNLSAEHRATYDRLVAEDQHDGLFPVPEAGPGDYEGGVTEADFPGADALEDSGGGELAAAGIEAGPGRLAGDQAEELKPERPPRPAAGGPRGGRGRRARRAQPRNTRTRKAADRIPAGPFIERLWTELAQAARKIPPIQRVMAAQAPMVGVVLGDAARGTFADPVIQWAARGEERLEAVNGVFGPLLWTGLILRFGGFEVQPVMHEGRPVLLENGEPMVQPVIDPETGQPDWNDQTRVMIGGLRMSLMSWVRISQRHASEIIARAEEQEALGAQADALIAFILAPPTRQSFRDMAREARQRTGVFLDDEAAGPPDDGGHQGGGAAPPVPDPAPAGAGQAPGTYPARAESTQPYPGMAMDPRTLGFMPPDEYTTSQVVPRAAIAQG